MKSLFESQLVGCDDVLGSLFLGRLNELWADCWLFWGRLLPLL